MGKRLILLYRPGVKMPSRAGDGMAYPVVVCPRDRRVLLNSERCGMVRSSPYIDRGRRCQGRQSDESDGQGYNEPGYDGISLHDLTRSVNLTGRAGPLLQPLSSTKFPAAPGINPKKDPVP